MTFNNLSKQTLSLLTLAALGLAPVACDSDDDGNDNNDPVGDDDDDDGGDGDSSDGENSDEEIPEDYAGEENPNDADDEDALEAGQELYEENCGCHGDDGSGGEGVADLTTSSAAAWADDYWLWKVSEGEGENMPGFKDALSEDEIWQVITYCRTLAE
ncbi:MAG: c-type cytochrome [Myxococcales bacterium FL481]|nr:MAG: c-type cytochrome [Myxococcales bacterium FL481]